MIEKIINWKGLCCKRLVIDVDFMHKTDQLSAISLIALLEAANWHFPRVYLRNIKHFPCVFHTVFPICMSVDVTVYQYVRIKCFMYR